MIRPTTLRPTRSETKQLVGMGSVRKIREGLRLLRIKKYIYFHLFCGPITYQIAYRHCRKRGIALPNAAHRSSTDIYPIHFFPIQTEAM